MFELGIEGGTLVTPRGRSRQHLYVADGKIAATTSEVQPAARRADASGLLVLPGMVDTHVHLMDPADLSREDFPTGTAAAARSGVTTVIEHTHARPVRTADDLREKRDYLADRSRVDFALAAHAWPGRLVDVEDVWHAGAAFIKAFTCTTHGVPGFEHGDRKALLDTIARLDAVCLIHCEDESMVMAAEQALRHEGRTDGGLLPLWRNRDAEIVAASTTALVARLTGGRVVIAHVSNPAICVAVQREREAGARVLMESCPQYLTLFEHEVIEQGAFRKFTPPARARSVADLDAMWTLLANGTIDFISSDHAPATVDQKTSGSIWDVHFGLPGIDTTCALLLDAAHHGRISYERMVEVYAEKPARTYGLFPQKGHLGRGADADLILVDPGARWTIRNQDILSRAGWSPYEGRAVTGRVTQTYLRGALIAENQRVTAEPGTGAFLAGAGARQETNALA